MFNKTKTKLVPAHHTGKKIAHQHTSYASLLFIILLVSVILVGVSHSASASTEGGGSYQTFAVVPGPPPTTAPQITSISNGQVFTSSPQIIRGTCVGRTLIKIFKNEVLAGDTICQNGSFSLTIDFFIGNNTIIARAYNTNDEVSPDSAAITIKFAPPGAQLSGTSEFNPLGAPVGQFYITTVAFYKGANAGDNLAWPLVVNGGTAPYAVSVGWGDGKTDLYSRGAAGNFDINHTYAKGPSDNSGYTIVINATDQQGNKSFLQLVALVNNSGQSALATTDNGKPGAGIFIKIAIMVLAGAALTVIGFWIGEWREKQLMNRKVHLV